MIFNSVQFGVFLAVVLAVYWRLGHRQQNVWLLGASYLFYGWWDWRFLGLMALSTAIDYVVTNAMREGPQRRRLLLISIVANLAILGTFKYFGFFVESADELLGWFGFASSLPTLEVILPVGISFYTFQTMSYTIDVYRRDLEPERDPVRFALFVSFFPQLVAGPIERATNLLPQIQRPRSVPGPDDVASGAMLILLGLFKKVAIADALGPTVDSVFGDAATDSGLTLLIGVYAFAIQIYADFSGYSDIARGTARLLGFELMVNFTQPYFSTSVTEFWRRWHISLSTWLRDYLYISLGGNRRGPRRTSFNLLATMLLGGLWHGAAWRFLVWGALHGTYLSVERWLTRRSARLVPPQPPPGLVTPATADGPQAERQPGRAGPGPAVAPARAAVTAAGAGAGAGGGGAAAVVSVRPDAAAAGAAAPSPVWRLVSWAITFHLVCLAWILFRADTFGAAVDHITGIATLRPGGVDLYALASLIPAAVAMVVIDASQRLGGSDTAMLRWTPALRGAFCAACVLGIVIFSGDPVRQFIYFQF